MLLLGCTDNDGFVETDGRSVGPLDGMEVVGWLVGISEGASEGIKVIEG